MSSLDDLRSTLDQHAADLHDPERYARPVAVRARVRAVRRRRAAGAATAVVLVLVAGLAGVGVLRGPDGLQPADTVVGVDIPRSIDVLGFPYALSGVADLTDDSLHVDPAPHDQAVLLAASGLGAGSATLYSQGDPVARVRGDEETTAPVALGEAGVDLEVRFDGTDARARAGVAVYEATGELAAGVDNGHAVFRQEVAGAPLVAGDFAAQGESSLELRAAPTGGRLRFVPYCRAPGDVWINVAVDGDGAVSFDCGDADRDAGVGSSGTTRVPAGDHRVRVYLSASDGGPEIEAPDGVEFGIGVYDPPAPGAWVLGSRTESAVEYGGRVWVLDDVMAEPTTVGTSAGDVLLGLVGRDGTVGLAWSGRLSQGRTLRMDTSDGSGSVLGPMLLAGDRYDVRFTGDGEGRLLVYRPE